MKRSAWSAWMMGLVTVFLWHGAEAAEFNAGSDANLRFALTQVAPGDVIIITAPKITVHDALVIDRAGTAAQPITIRSMSAAVSPIILGDSSQLEVFTVRVPYWHFEGITVRGANNFIFHLNSAAHDVVIRGVRADTFGSVGVFGDCDGPAGAPRCDRVTVEDSLFTGGFTTGADNCAARGIDVLAASGWVIQRNSFRGFRMDSLVCPGAPSYGVIIRRGTTSTTVDSNYFFDNFSGFSIGALSPMGAPCEDTGALVSNNIIAASDDAGSILIQACATKVFNNTFWNNGAVNGAARSIELFGAATTSSLINNIFNAAPLARDGAQPTQTSNFQLVTSVDATIFIDPRGENFRIVPGAPTIDVGQTVPEVTHDVEGRLRPLSVAYDVGAIEFPPGGYTTSPSVPGGGGGGGSDGGGRSVGPGGPGGGVYPIQDRGCNCKMVDVTLASVLSPLLLSLALLLLIRRRS